MPAAAGGGVRAVYPIVETGLIETIDTRNEKDIAAFSGSCGPDGSCGMREGKLRDR